MTADSTTPDQTLSTRENQGLDSRGLKPGSDRSGLSHVPQMRAESGYEEIESVAPLRFSGFICLIVGLISVVAMLGLPALVVPFVAIVFGLIALRPSDHPKPVGTTAAKIGIFLAVTFGVCGYFLPWMKANTLGNQAEFYSRQYIGILANNHPEVAIELSKDFKNRFSESMPLDQFYDGSNDDRQRNLYEFRDNGANVLIRELGPDAEWLLDRPVEVYKKFGIERAEVVWKAAENDRKIHFFMQYLIDPNDVGQWHVERLQEYRELIVAESVL